VPLCRLGGLVAALLVFGCCLSGASAQAAIAINYHPGWLDSDPATTIEVAAGWPADPQEEGYFPWPVAHPIAGDCTFGVNNPTGNNQPDISDFWNPSLVYGPPSHLWMIDEGAYLETTCSVPVTQDKPWLFVHFAYSDWNDGAAEIAVREQAWSDWLTVGLYDCFGRLDNWVSIEGLTAGNYYVRVTARAVGRSVLSPNGGMNYCLEPADDLHPTRIGTTAPVPPEDICVTSGGWVPVDGGKANLGMEIQFTAGEDRPRGTVTYVDHVYDVALHSTEILGIIPGETEATISLLVRGNDDTERAMRVYVYDGAATGEDDYLSVWVTDDWNDCTTGWPYFIGQPLGGGQIKLH